jgi:hypothetical protein
MPQLPPYPAPPRGLHAARTRAAVQLLRLGAGGLLPARCYGPPPPVLAPAAAPEHIEIVSHCWGYSRLLACQLAALIAHPPAAVTVTMTVFHAEADTATVDLLARIGAIRVPGVRWQWRRLPPPQLFRRSIGRNLAARATTADWIWFTDCDVVFGPGALDGLAVAVRGSRSPLVYPEIELATVVLDAASIAQGTPETLLRHADPARCTARRLTRATGPMQITRGDTARALGYCAAVGAFQQPARRWCKAHEDRVFRRQLRTAGTPLPVPAVYRLRHAEKGRDAGRERLLRRNLRRLRSAWQDRRRI